MAQTYGGGGGVDPSFNYFSHGTGTSPFQMINVSRAPKAKPKKKTYYSSGTATKPRPYSTPYRSSPQRAPRAPSAPRAPYRPSGGGTGGGYQAPRSGKSVGSNSSGRIAKTAPAPPAKPAPPPMTSEQWIAKGGDKVYQQQRDALALALKDYNARSEKDVTDYGITNTANREALVGEQGRSRQDLINDYVARGALGGAEQTALTQFDTDWGKRLGDFDTAYTNWGLDAQRAKADYGVTNKNQLTKAQQDAIARRAASLI